MTERFDAPGAELEPKKPDPAFRFAEVVQADDVRARWPWDQYLLDPDPERIGVSCSGGGIRSASYCLGALQVLRGEGVLGRARFLAAVSGGNYIATAHTLLVSESLRRAAGAAGADECGDGDDERTLFGELPPWAPGSPEEQHLRNDSNWLAPGLRGKAWLALNVVYGVVRHLVPFAAAIFLTAMAYGLSVSWWIGPSIRDTPGHVSVSFLRPAFVVIALGLIAGFVLVARQHVGRSRDPDPRTLNTLQNLASRTVLLQLLAAFLLILVPALLLWVARIGPVFETGWTRLTALLTVESGSLALLGTLAWLNKRGYLKRLVPLGTALLGPLVVAIPFVSLAYWIAGRGLPLGWLPLTVAAVSVVLLVIYAFIDETTPTTHLFYKERLATAFVGYRRLQGGRFRRDQPPWKDAILFSEICTGSGAATLPDLVVCAAVNISDPVLPPGRLAASFTFERERSGGPLTGYVSTKDLECRAPLVTLPALIAVSGAALSPSMGKMTRSWARLLMALFNVRLGVWLPNPLHAGTDAFPASAVDVRRNPDLPTWEPPCAPRAASDTAPIPPTATGAGAGSLTARARRPGTWYVLREALGLNSLDRPFVYVTDGGHWENLGLVELLRRGCGQILCFDAAGDDIHTFHTLSEAISLARSDLGVRIEFAPGDLERLKPEESESGGPPLSPTDHVTGRIVYPDGTEGRLIFAKATVPGDAPQDLIDYRQRDPRFPTHSTGNQLFDDRQFESYRALGAHAARGVVADFRAGAAPVDGLADVMASPRPRE
jgi:hypothetical protein